MIVLIALSSLPFGKVWPVLAQREACRDRSSIFSATNPVHEIGGACLLAFIVGSGLFYHFMGWKLDGTDLIMVCGLIMIYVNLFRSQLRQASDRINELEKRFAALRNTRAVE
jgi:hypothetical protein